MHKRLSGDHLEALVTRIWQGEEVGEALWNVAGPRLLIPGADAIEDPASVTVTVTLRPRVAEFLRTIDADHAQLQRYFTESLAAARMIGLNAARAKQAVKEKGDGRGVVVMPREMLDQLR